MLIETLTSTSLIITLVGFVLILVGLLLELQKGYSQMMIDVMEVIGIFLVCMEIANRFGYTKWWPWTL